MDDFQLLVAQRPSVEPPSPLVQTRARAELMTLIDAELVVIDAPKTVHRPRGPRRRARVLVAALVAAVIAALVVANIGDGGTGAVAAVLERAANVAADQSAPPPDAVVYTRSISMVQDTSVDDGHETVTKSIVTREIWIAPDGSGRARETRGTSQGDESYGPGGLSREDFSQWPTTPDAIAEKLRSEAERTDVSVPVEMFVRAGDYLKETGAPPAIRAALYRVLASLPNIDLLGITRDHEGRSGTGVAITEHGEQYVLIFDPSTSQLLAEEAIDAGTGNVDSWTSYLESRFTDAVPPGGTPAPATSLSPAGTQAHS